MSTNYQLLPDRSTGRVQGTQYSVTVNAYPAGVTLDPANLPAPLFSAQFTGNDSDDNATALERARVAIEAEHKAALQLASEQAALAARLAAFAKPVTVTVEDA